ncbi:MAG: hypothetical protein HOE90_07135 [Bacteriovoracaceae bacterium]|jgi:hypothetical protein|nr:hypothetical protein [Bacteriovoracaceae bacterium]
MRKGILNGVFLLITLIFLSGCGSDEGDNPVEYGAATGAGSPSGTSSYTNTSGVATTDIDTIEELVSFMEGQSLDGGGLQAGSNIKKMYFQDRRKKHFEINSIAADSVDYDLTTFSYSSNWGFSTSGNFFNGNLSISFGSTGWQRVGRIKRNQVLTKTEKINNMFYNYGTCYLMSSGNVNFDGGTYQGHQVDCLSNSGYNIKRMTIVPDLPLLLNPIHVDHMIRVTPYSPPMSTYNVHSHYIFDVEY